MKNRETLLFPAIAEYLFLSSLIGSAYNKLFFIFNRFVTSWVCQRVVPCALVPCALVPCALTRSLMFVWTRELMMQSVLIQRMPRVAKQSILTMCAVWWRVMVILLSAPVTGQRLNSSLSSKTVSTDRCHGNKEVVRMDFRLWELIEPTVFISGVAKQYERACTFDQIN